MYALGPEALLTDEMEIDEEKRDPFYALKWARNIYDTYVKNHTRAVRIITDWALRARRIQNLRNYIVSYLQISRRHWESFKKVVKIVEGYIRREPVPDISTDYEKFGDIDWIMKNAVETMRQELEKPKNPFKQMGLPFINT